MKNSSKKGFTIVELVIVIAVIAILAAVLIPTFSGLVKKANLSSDMQAVREMNMALKTAEAKNGKPKNVEEAMKVIADAGYDVDAWQPLTANYQVYWFIDDNQCVLYSTADKKVEYPDSYKGTDLVAKENNDKFFLYNQTFKKAIEKDFKYDSSVAKDETVNNQSYANAIVRKSDESETSNAYASVIIQETENKKVYTIATTIKSGATAEEKEAAQKAAGEYLYSLFTQVNLKMITGDYKIVFDTKSATSEEERTINIKNTEWKPIKLFTGYLGTNDDTKPIIIDGLRLTNATAYTETYQFLGTGSLYYCSGFIGAVHGTATIENITFKNVEIITPADDCIVLSTGNTSNTTAIIGGIVRTEETKGETNVVIRNVRAENCSVTSMVRAGGLIGYIGGYSVPDKQAHGSDWLGLTGSVVIDNCYYSGSVESKKLGDGYGTAGGIIGYTNKDTSSTTDKNLKIFVNNCEVDATIKGYTAAGIVGNYYSLSAKDLLYKGGELFITNCTVKNADKITATEKSVIVNADAQYVKRNDNGIDNATFTNCGVTPSAIKDGQTDKVVDTLRTILDGTALENVNKERDDLISKRFKGSN